MLWSPGWQKVTTSAIVAGSDPMFLSTHAPAADDGDRA
jgi:hypothetical protein